MTSCQPCNLPLVPATKILHRPHCPLDTRTLLERVETAIADPGQVVDRDDFNREPYPRWTARAVLEVLAAEQTARGVVDVELAPSGATTPGGEAQCRRRVATADGYTMRCTRAAAHDVDALCRYVQESDNTPT